MDPEHVRAIASIKGMLTSIRRRVTENSKPRQLKIAERMIAKANRKIDAISQLLSTHVPCLGSTANLESFRDSLNATRDRLIDLYPTSGKRRKKRDTFTNLKIKLDASPSAETFVDLIAEFKDTPGKARYMVYNAYIGSRAWASKRRAFLGRNGHSCLRCGGMENIEVHHKTYARLGSELDEDLEALCRPCHVAEHRKS